jgi:hypothetical protein
MKVKRLTVGGILKHTQLLRFDSLLGAALFLVFYEERFEFLTPDLMQTRSFVRAEKGPLAVLFDTLHARKISAYAL